VPHNPSRQNRDDSQTSPRIWLLGLNHNGET